MSWCAVFITVINLTAENKAHLFKRPSEDFSVMGEGAKITFMCSIQGHNYVVSTVYDLGGH